MPQQAAEMEIIMFINKDGKLFGKISIIDIIVVLAIIVAAFGIYNRFSSANAKVATVTQQIEYTLSVKDVRLGTVEALQNKSPIYDATTKEYLGEITDVSYTNAISAKTMQNGEIKNLEIPEKYDVTVTVKVDGKVNNSGYYTANNIMLTAGSKHVIYSKYAKTTGEIMSIHEVR